MNYKHILFMVEKDPFKYIFHLFFDSFLCVYLCLDCTHPPFLFSQTLPNTPSLLPSRLLLMAFYCRDRTF